MIVARDDGAAGVCIVLEVKLEEPGAGTVAALVAVKLVGQRIMVERRLEIVRRIEHPVGLLRQTEQRHGEVAADFVADLEEERGLARAAGQRARTARVENAPPGERGQIGH